MKGEYVHDNICGAVRGGIFWARYNRERMAAKTKIEWTDATWNPVRGCTKISPGCKHCYAETFAERFRGVRGHPYERGFDLRLVPEKLFEPFLWTAPSMVFVNSMSDLFHENVPDSYIIQVARVMMTANWHTYQVLTKRSCRLVELLNGTLHFATQTRHIWWGVSVEDVKHGKPRIEDIRRAPALVKFLSIEPLIEDLERIDLSGIDWVIVGGESGPGARPMKEEWVRSLLGYCRQYEVPFFFKQWGGVQKKKAGREIEGQTYDEFPFTAGEIIPSRVARRQMASDLEARFVAHGAYQEVRGNSEVGRARSALISGPAL
jgi:protein gp37